MGQSDINQGRACSKAKCAGPWIKSHYDFAPWREREEIPHTDSIMAGKHNILLVKAPGMMMYLRKLQDPFNHGNILRSFPL